MDILNIHKSQKLKFPKTEPVVGKHKSAYFVRFVHAAECMSCVCLSLCLSVYVRLYMFVQLIKEGKRYDDLTEVAKLFNLHGTDQVEAAEETKSTEGEASSA